MLTSVRKQFSMKLENLFGDNLDISQDNFNKEVSLTIKTCKRIDTCALPLNDPKTSLEYIADLMAQYKTMLESRYIHMRELRSLLRNIIVVATCNYNSLTGRNTSKSYSFLKATLKKKNADYGNSAVKNGGLVGNYVRMSDKLNRLQNLTAKTKAEQNFESISDTWLDLAGYAVIGVIISKLQENIV